MEMGEIAPGDESIEDVDEARFISAVDFRFFDADKRVLPFGIAVGTSVGGVEDDGLLLFAVFNEERFPLEYSLRNSSIVSSTYGSCPSICRCSCKA